MAARAWGTGILHLPLPFSGQVGRAENQNPPEAGGVGGGEQFIVRQAASITQYTKTVGVRHSDVLPLVVRKVEVVGPQGLRKPVGYADQRRSVYVGPDPVVQLRGDNRVRREAFDSQDKLPARGIVPILTKQLPGQRLSRVSKERSLSPLVRETSFSAYCPKCTGPWTPKLHTPSGALVHLAPVGLRPHGVGPFT